jgi:hypothetical protein
VPYDLLRVTPYVVLCETSIGGHLGWIESGGGRWSNTTVQSFFRKLVTETDGIASLTSETKDIILVGGQELKSPVFDPIRRRLFWPENEATA